MKTITLDKYSNIRLAWTTPGNEGFTPYLTDISNLSKEEQVWVFLTHAIAEDEEMDEDASLQPQIWSKQ